MRKALCFLVGVLTTVSMISCSSDDNSDNSTLEDNFKDRSLVKSITLSINTHMFERYKYSLSYNSTGNLQSIICDRELPYSYTREEHYSWPSDSILVELQADYNEYWSTEKYSRNSNGYVTSGEIIFQFILPRDEFISTTLHNYNCLYNEKNQLLQITGYVNSRDNHFDYTWKNGNVILINKSNWDLYENESNYLYELEYYTDLKETRDIGIRFLPINLDYYFWGGQSLRGEIYAENLMFLSKNLLKKHSNGSTTIEYFYDFDSSGRVIRQTQAITGYNQQNIQSKEYTYEYFD